MNRKVSYARLQTGLHIPGVGEVGQVLPPNGKTLDQLDMTTTEAGVNVKFAFRLSITVAPQTHELLIPYANFIVLKLLPEEKTVKVVKSA